MSDLTKFFITGSTGQYSSLLCYLHISRRTLGYIGSIVLERFLDHPNAASFELSTLVRTQEKADKLKAMGVQRPVLGKLQNLALMEEESARADIIVNMVSLADSSSARQTLDAHHLRF